MLCFLPALAIATYRLIDRTQHRNFVPKFDKFAAVVMKIRFPVLALVVLLLPASFLGQQNNDFLRRKRGVQHGGYADGKGYGGINLACTAPPIRWCLWFPKGDMEKEISMNEGTESWIHVTSVVST